MDNPVSLLKLGWEYDDLRVFSDILEAFWYTAMEYDADKLTTEFLSSLLNSIILGHSLYYQNRTSILTHFETGVNIEFAEALYGPLYNANNVVRVTNSIEELKWAGKDVALFWIENTHQGSELLEKNSLWEQYKYCQYEEQMLLDYSFFNNMNDYGIQHLLYYIKHTKSSEDHKIDYNKCLDIALSKYDLKDVENVQYVVDEFGNSFGVYYYEEFEKALFDKLISRGCTNCILAKNNLANRYNDFLRDRYN